MFYDVFRKALPPWEAQENVIHNQWLRKIYDYGTKYSVYPEKRLKLPYGSGYGKGENL